VPVLGATIADIDEAHLWTFLREFAGDAFDNAGASGYPTASVLERDLLLATNHDMQVVPTVAGMLLFGRDESVTKLLPRSTVIATRFAGDSNQAPVIERLELNGNLHTLHEAAIRFIRRYCDLWEKRPRTLSQSSEDSPVPARANYQQDALTEAVANLLMHRDLALRDQPTRIHVFDRSLELINPRRTAGFSPLAQRAIKYGIPQRLNPQVAAVFSSPAYGLKLAPGGLPILLRQSRLFANRKADIVAFNDEFRLRLYGV